MILSRKIAILAAGILFCGTALPLAAQKRQIWGGDRTIPVHLIPLMDENNEQIFPTEIHPLPFSARFTCGSCHDYDIIRGGLHFNTSASSASGRPGEPWFWSDPRTGTHIPLSYRQWPGIWDPRELDLTSWDITLLFGRHFPGGGAADPDNEEAAASPTARWNVSGKAEINCLACHNRSGRQDSSEWAKQILRENFRWAATAAGGIGEVGGMASRLRSTWDIYDGPNLDDREWAVAPFVKYRTADFDGKHRYFFDLAYQPDDARCLACHSVSPVSEEKYLIDGDVHAAAGLRCTDCHGNNLGHDMIRGYEGEGEERGDKSANSFTCRGCHLGENPEGDRKVVPGRMGAPYPQHRGIPLSHFRRLNCTVCHSGPRPSEDFTRLRTSRANRLGIHGAAQWWTESPNITAPVFVRDKRGKLTPSRLVWPSFWVRIKGRDVIPVRPEVIESAAAEILDAETRIARILAALTMEAEEGETPVLVSEESAFTVNIDGGLDKEVRGSEKKAPDFLWGIRSVDTFSPLVPDFDPADEDKDLDIELRIERFLGALGTVEGAPGKPVLVVRRTLYQIKDGYFDISDAPEEAAESAGWGWLENETILPLASDFDLRTINATGGREETLTEEQAILILQALKKSAASEVGAPSGDSSEEGESRESSRFGYISGGRLFSLAGGTRLRSRSHPAASPVTWPLAHDVRPAQQSLGWKGCKDCHRAGSDFFFNTIKANGPLLTGRRDVRTAGSFMELGGFFQRVFGLSFVVRPLFKIVLGACAVIVASLLVLAFMAVLRRLSGLGEKW